MYACSFCVAVFCVLRCVRECFHFVLQWNVASTSCYCIRYSMWERGWDLTQPVHHAHVCCMELQVKHFWQLPYADPLHHEGMLIALLTHNPLWESGAEPLGKLCHSYRWQPLFLFGIGGDAHRDILTLLKVSSQEFYRITKSLLVLKSLSRHKEWIASSAQMFHIVNLNIAVLL